MAPRTPLLLLLGACATTAAPPPAAPSTCVVAIALRTRPDRNVHAGRPVTAYFVRLADDADPTRQPELLRSNHAHGGVLFLLDAPPGRYAAVACYGKGDTGDWTAYFPEDLIRATEKKVPEGKAVLLGSFEANLRSVSTSGDAAQQHYLRLLAPGWDKRSTALKVFTRDDHAWAGPWRDEGDAEAVRAGMKKSLGAAWASRFE